MSADSEEIGWNLERGRDAWSRRMSRQSCDADLGDRRRTESRILRYGFRFLDNYPFYCRNDKNAVSARLLMQSRGILTLLS
jgi:hypothetical protein